VQPRYHDTVPEPRVVRAAYEAAAGFQDATILEVFRAGGPYFATSPSRLARQFPAWPLTSIRRALTNLTTRGLLEKRAETITGLYGRREHLWTLARPAPVEQRELGL